jgi:hypothetical protein
MQMLGRYYAQESKGSDSINFDGFPAQHQAWRRGVINGGKSWLRLGNVANSSGWDLVPVIIGQQLM